MFFQRHSSYLSETPRISVCFSVVVIKVLTKTNVGRKGFIWLGGYRPSFRRGNWRQELEQRPPRRHSLSWPLIFPDNSSLWQIDKKPNQDSQWHMKTESLFFSHANTLNFPTSRMVFVGLVVSAIPQPCTSYRGLSVRAIPSG